MKIMILDAGDEHPQDARELSAGLADSVLEMIAAAATTGGGVPQHFLGTLLVTIALISYDYGRGKLESTAAETLRDVGRNLLQKGDTHEKNEGPKVN